MDALWPDLDPEAAGSNLRKAVHLARRALREGPSDAELIESAAEALALPRDAWVDVEAFQAAAASARRSNDQAAYGKAVSLYGGDLLPDDRYEDWVTLRSDELRSELGALLSEQASLLEARGDLDGAAAALRRALSAEPLEEDLGLRLMRVLALAGRRREALEVYDRVSDALMRELGSQPSVETQQLREEISTRSGLAPELTAELWQRVGGLRMLAGDLVGAATAFESAIENAGTGGTGLLVMHLEAARAYLGLHDVERAEPNLSTAEALNENDGSERVSISVLNANVAWERGDLDAASAFADEALSFAEVRGDPEDLTAAHETVAIVCHYRGAWREGLDEEMERLGRLPDGDSRLGNVFDIHHCIGQYHLYGDGLWERVEGYARETLDRADRLGAVRAQAFAWCLLGESLLLQARFDEAAGCLERSGELHGTLGQRSGALAWQRLAELLVCRGQPDEAAGPLRRASAIATVSPMARHLWGRIYATSALAALADGDPGEAVRGVQAAAAAAARYGDCPTCSALLNPVAAKAYASLDEAEGARWHAEAAAHVARMFGSSAWSAMAASAEGDLKLAEGDSLGARERALVAVDLYERAGQPYWADRARAQARNLSKGRRNAQGTATP